MAAVLLPLWVFYQHIAGKARDHNARLFIVPVRRFSASPARFVHTSLLLLVELSFCHGRSVMPAPRRVVRYSPRDVTASNGGCSVVNDSNLIWVDMEMTGLIPEQHRVIEIATIVTDSDLNELAEGPVIAIHQPEAELAAMDEWNTRTHTGTGLVERIRASRYDEATAVQATLDFLSQWVFPGKSPMCGNSICQDRRFMARHMPALEAFFHYRNLDVSSLKILAARWRPDLTGAPKRNIHLALEDIRDSIEELRYYRAHFLRTA